MRIGHIAMYVNNLEKEKEFFEIYFDAKAGDKYVHEEIGFSSYFLEFQDGARLELMHNTESGPRTTGDGYYESCILDPEGNQIEITADTYLEC